jgi:hypothetical protein
MKVTKHDLSFNKADLSLPDLIRTTEIAVGMLTVSLNKHLADFGDLYRKGGDVSIYLKAEHIVEDAKCLQQCAETLGVLRGAADRDEINVIKEVK